jgi:4-amino-4-deoxy-L-arabinose transferase-like glycosyltransferase
MPRRAEVALVLFLVLFSLAGIFDRTLWGTNDTRGAGIVLDMWRHHTWVVATINGDDFLDKPPLTYWAALVFAWIFGGVSEGVARLPCALAGLGTLLLMRRLVKDPLAAWAGIFLCATTVTFLGYARGVMTDMPLTFCVTLALFLFWRAETASSTGSARWIPFLLAAPASFYAKGFAGPALIGCAVAAYLVVRRRWKTLLGLGAVSVPLLAVAVLPWAVALERARGSGALRYALWDNQFGRFFAFSHDPNSPPWGPLFSHKESWYYYFVNLPAALGPAVFLVAAAVAALYMPGSAYRGRFLTFVRCGILGMFLLLELSTSKVAVYALPLFPFLFVAVGIWLADLACRERPALWERSAVLLFFGIWGLFLLAVPTGTILAPKLRPELFIPSENLGPGRFVLAGSLCLAAVVLAIVILARRLASGPRAVIVPLLPAALALLLFLDYELVLPIFDRHKTYVPLAGWVALETRDRELGIATVEFNAIGAFAFYMEDRRMTVVNPVDRAAEFLASASPRALIAYRRDLRRLEPVLASVPHAVLTCDDPGARSHDFVLIRN